MSALPVDLPRDQARLYLPAGWAGPAPDRDVALDLLRGLAMAILVINHLRLASPLSAASSALLSAAEVLVAVSGVVVGVVFGRRWRTRGARATTRLLLLRAATLYRASVVVVALVAAARLIPGLATAALTTIPNGGPSTDLYSFGGAGRTVLAIVTLEAGPWQLSILGFFIVVIALAPSLLWALARGWWPAVLLLSVLVYGLGRSWPVDVLPTQSERPFPILVWQLLFVGGLVLGWYRPVLVAGNRWVRWWPAGAVAVGVLSALALLLGPVVLDAAAWSAWKARHFDKSSLDPLRILAMTSMAALAYLLVRRIAESGSWPRRLLLALGQNSFYVFIVHVFLSLAVASALAPMGGTAGPIGNMLIAVGVLAVLLAMVERRFLFRWVPR